MVGLNLSMHQSFVMCFFRHFCWEWLTVNLLLSFKNLYGYLKIRKQFPRHLVIGSCEIIILLNIICQFVACFNTKLSIPMFLKDTLCRKDIYPVPISILESLIPPGIELLTAGLECMDMYCNYSTCFKLIEKSLNFGFTVFLPCRWSSVTLQDMHIWNLEITNGQLDLDKRFV